MADAPRRGTDTYRYVPPDQVVAHARTWIEDVLLDFTLTLTGSVLVSCGEDGRDVRAQDSLALRMAGEVLHQIADGLFVSAVRGAGPTIESAGGHRFTHVTSGSSGPRTRRFAGRCTVSLPAAGRGHPAVRGALGYTLDVRAATPADHPGAGATQWTERYERALAAIGAVVLAPVPVTADRAARLYPA